MWLIKSYDDFKVGIEFPKQSVSILHALIPMWYVVKSGHQIKCLIISLRLFTKHLFCPIELRHVDYCLLNKFKLKCIKKIKKERKIPMLALVLSLSQFHRDITKFRNSFRTRRKLNRHTKAVISNNTQKHQLPPQIIARASSLLCYIIRRFEIFVFHVHFDKRQLSYPAPYLGLVYSHACKLIVIILKL